MTNASQPSPPFGNLPVAKNHSGRIAHSQCSTLATACPSLSGSHVYWLGGWGVAERDMLGIVQQQIPQAEHSVFVPSPASLETLYAKLKGSATETPVLAGYSTGAFLLLRELERLAPLLPPNTQVLLFAPFADFRAESGLGGRVVSTRLRLLLRRLRSDPQAALADFYQQSGIALKPPATLPYAAADLLWGIEQLAQTAVCVKVLECLHDNTAGLHITAWVGAGDALLEAQQIATLFAPGQCRIVQEAGHDLASLLIAANAEGALLP